MEKENSSIINQLKNDGHDGIPTIEQTGVPDESVASITPAKVSMTADDTERRRPARPKGKVRQPLNLEDLPKAESPEDKVSLENEIKAEVFKPGGDFDKMIERKKREMEEDIKNAEFAEQVAAASKKISGAGRELPTGATEVMDNVHVAADNVPENDDDEYFDEEDDFDDDDLSDEVYDTTQAATIDINDDDFDDDGYDEEPEEQVEEVEVPETKPEIKSMDESTKQQEDTNNVIQVDFKDAGSISETVDIGSEFDEDNTPTDDDDISEEERDLRTQYLKEEISKKLRPISKKLDVSGFTVVKRGTKTSTAFNKEVPLAKWPLINTGIVVTTKAISGSLLELLRTHISNNDTKAALKIMYDHIVSAKPMNFTAWAKGIDAEDFDHLFFSFYISAFQGSNFIPIDCPNNDCPRKVFITDDIPFIKMVDFHTKENKAKFNKIYNEEPSPNTNGDTVSYRIALSDMIAVDISRPSLYSEYIEMTYINDRYIRANADVISYMRYIDEMYTIDAATGSLIPIEYKEDPNNEGRTVANKVRAYAKAIRTLTSDELAVLDAHISKLADDTVEITYRRPATKCTICGEEIKEEPMSAAALVFIRNRLALLTII